MKCTFIKENRQIFTVTCMYGILNIEPSSYYDWINRDISDQQIYRNQCELLVKAAHSEIREQYGIWNMA
ncbi:hypothetical protein [Psychrobacter sp. DAB_AL43B]|uniref:hypothetical protein n=1 Tax=Psychrobacter sp. DAB_AL43B TaxID=1028416 RepID=UPI0009C1C8EF|nr:hypothetical protein [Psychrobacter sp. DAB_AL43B]SLJ84758.1 hypothetical protein DABAL43B_1563 [Psychrobacter sp. DAB_AL43B]